MFNIEAFSSLPKNLKSSDYVDVMLLLSGSKRAIRLGKNTTEVYEKMDYWCKKFKYRSKISCSGLMYISKYFGLATLVNIVDDSFFPHAYILGCLLGYPSCCSKKIAKLGEAFIDKWEKKLIMSGGFNIDYTLINPAGYLSGTSLISHVPCSCECKKSLKIAKVTLKTIKMYKDYDCINRWKKWLE